MTIRRVLCCTPDWKAVLLLVILCCVAMHQRDAFSQGGNATDPLKGGIRVVENLEIAAIRSGSGNQIHSWDRENSIHYAWGAGFGDASDWREIVSGDFDGDGLDEIAAIRKSSGGKLFIWDWDGSHGITEFEGWGAASEWRGLAAGNFDDDEADELVAVRTNVSGAQFVVWDGNGTCSQSWGDGFYDQSDWRGVIAADVDGDGVDEVVALRRSSAYNIYAWKINGQSRTLLKETGNYGSGSDWRGLTAGDFDGDGIDEVAAVRTGVSTEQFFIWDLYGGSPTLSWGAGFGDQSDWRGIAAGDFDADGADEVVAIRRTSGNNVFIHDPNNGVMTSNFGQYGPNSDWRGLATGDFDADGADEIAAVRANDNVDQFFIWVRSQQNEFVTADQWQLSSVDWRGLAVGNFDGDGISLRFTGNSGDHTSPAHVVAYLSVPPFELGQMGGREFYTKYGQGESYDTTMSNSITVASSITLSYEVEDPLGVFGAGFGVTVESGMRSTLAETKSFRHYNFKVNEGSTTEVDSAGRPLADDAVITGVTHYQWYEYEQLDGTSVVQKLILSVPYSHEVTSYSIREFNQLTTNPIQGDHVVGQVASYPLQPRPSGGQLLWQDTFFTSVGTGSAEEWSLEIEKTSISETALRFRVNAFGQIKVGGVQIASSVGLTTETSHSIAIGKSTVFGGKTAPVANSAYRFNYRPYVWKNPDGYVAIDYAVDPSSLRYGYFPDLAIEPRDITWIGGHLWVNVHNLGHNSNNINDKPVKIKAYGVKSNEERLLLGMASTPFIPKQDSASIFTYMNFSPDDISLYSKIRVEVDPDNHIEEHNASSATRLNPEVDSNNAAEKPIIRLGRERLDWNSQASITLSDSIFVLADSLLIPSGKTLKINNASLFITTSPSSQPSVTVDGTLELHNAWITATNWLYPFTLAVSGSYRPDSQSGMRGQSISYNLSVALSLSTSQPVEGDLVDITATVRNTSRMLPVSYIDVLITDGHPDSSDADRIGYGRIQALDTLESADIVVRWNTEGRAGDHEIYAVLDPSDRHEETDENDNRVSAVLRVHQAPEIVHQPLTQGQFALPGKPYEVIAQITDADNDLDSLRLYYRANQGTGWSGWSVVSLSPSGNPDEFSATIPNQPAGTQVEYYVYAKDQLEHLSTLPDSALAGVYYHFRAFAPVILAIGDEFSGHYAFHGDMDVGYQWLQVFVADSLVGTPLFVSAVEPTSKGPGIPTIHVFRDLSDANPTITFSDNKLLKAWTPLDRGDYYFKISRSRSTFRYFGFAVNRLADMEQLLAGWRVGGSINCDLGTTLLDFLDFFAITSTDPKPYFVEIQANQLDIFWRAYEIGGTDITRTSMRFNLAEDSSANSQSLSYEMAPSVADEHAVGFGSPGQQAPVRFEIWGPRTPATLPETVVFVLTGGKDGSESSGSYSVSHTESTTPPGQAGGEEGLSMWPGQQKSGTIGANKPPVYFTNFNLGPGSYWLTCRARKSSPVQPQIFVYGPAGAQVASERQDGFLPFAVPKAGRYWFAVINPSAEESLDYEINLDDSTTIAKLPLFLQSQRLHPKSNPFELYAIDMDSQFAYTLDADNMTANGYLQLFDAMRGFSVASADDPEKIEAFYPPHDSLFILMVQTYALEATYDVKTVIMRGGNVAPTIAGTTQLSDTYDTLNDYTVATTVSDRSIASVKLVYRLNGGTWLELNMTNPPADTSSFEAAIPAVTGGGFVEFYIRAEDGDGNVTTDPGAAPASTFSFHVLAPRTVAVGQEYQGPYPNLGMEWMEIADLDAGAAYYLAAAEPSPLGPGFPQIEISTSRAGNPVHALMSPEALRYFSPVTTGTYYFRVIQSVSAGREYGFLLNRLEDFFALAAESDFVSDSLDCNLDRGATDILDVFAITSTSADSYGVNVDMSHINMTWRVYDKWGNRIARPLGWVWGPYAPSVAPETVLLALTGAGADSSSEGAYQIRTELAITTAVELETFAAIPAFDRILIKWSTRSPGFAFHIHRSEQHGIRRRLTDNLIVGKSPYQFEDRQVRIGIEYFYWLEAIDPNGRSTLHGPVSARLLLPASYALYQNYPNPFNAETTIRYQLPRNEWVRIEVFDILGRRVRVLADEPKEAGYHRIQWDARNGQGGLISSGVYFCTMKAGSFRETKKLMVLK